MSSNYPPGVTGNELEIAGPDAEEVVECPTCDQPAEKLWYRGKWWINCTFCHHYSEGRGDDNDDAFELSQDR